MATMMPNIKDMAVSVSRLTMSEAVMVVIPGSGGEPKLPG
jgi:hypothetical protein